LKALADSSNSKRYHCDWQSVQLNEAYTQLVPENIVMQLVSWLLADPDELSILDVKLDWEAARQITTGTGNAASGAASFAYLETAIAHSSRFQGIVTGPVPSLRKASG